ncbi:symplekin [Plakobranchus ocellatus]|uniref:Symplekin n=1 Tax=Plakobranchus ocellatus TaxID=259542 RepID=A0AAV4CRZ2_9GAST|nr:symplekin [Plakobranchus ocellatus]
MASPGREDDTMKDGPSPVTGPAAKINKRSTAAQFFNKDVDLEKASDPATSTYDVVVELLNNAAVMTKGADKIVNLKKAQELIVHKSSDLLDNFLDEMLAFQSDQSKDVKRFIVGFMEEACKKDFECLPKVMPSMVMLLGDDDINVQKKVILTVSSMFRLTLAWISKAKQTRSEMKEVWMHLNEVKNLMYDLLESANDGIRTHAVKFLEGLTMTLSKKTQDSEIPKKNEEDFSIEQLPESNGIVDVSALEEEGRKAFSTMLQFQSSPHISSINLMTVMNSLANIAKQRPEFFDQVVQSFEALHVNLPPTLAKSQVSSVRKNLKTQMMGLLKHPASVEFLPQISTLLTDLGASQSEIAKNSPKETESRKRKTFKEPGGFGTKKARIEIDDDDDGLTPWVDRTSKKAKPEPAQKQTAIDVTAEDILPRLTAQNVTDLVLLSMVMLPDNMPALFESTYTPVAAAGTQTQISHIARLLATQLTMAGMGKGLGELQMQALKSEAAEQSKDDDEQPTSPKQVIQTVVGLTTEQQAEQQPPPSKKLKISQLPMPPGVRKIKQFQLSHATKQLSDSEMEKMAIQSLERILYAEKAASSGQVEQHRTKILACLTSLFGQTVKLSLLKFIFSDLRNRQDLIFSWLYQEYANCQRYSTAASDGRSAVQGATVGSYSNCLTSVLAHLQDMDDHHGDMIFHRVLLEAPLLTDNAIIIVRRYCSVEEHTEAGMKTLSQLIANRPAHRHTFLDIILEFTSHEKEEIRNVAIKAAQALHTSGKMQAEIEQYANQQLKKLLLAKPPSLPGAKLEELPEAWTEESIKARLYLHLGLLPSNHKLIHELANVYTATNADIKRAILRVLESPVKGMGMDSPELLTLVENCPKGSETLVMRVIHILTDKAVPSPQLVERIRDLYHKRVPDVRFLIPVLNGLSKAEVMEALPKLIKLNPMVVKEVFNRLMGSHALNNDSVYQSPLTPVELLVALHNIDPSKCDIKTTIKAANLCFAEKATYTQEVLAMAMKQLMEQDPLPTLFMRTVLQSLSMYPRLVGFVLNILQRLIVKKVWKQKRVWEGFIRCCQRAKPQSFQVLLQLPASQLRDVFEVCPDLREPLYAHVQTFTENQKAHINKALISVLEECPDKDNEKMDSASKGEQIVPSVPEAEVTHLGNSVENKAISNLTAVKTLDNSFRPDEENTKSDSTNVILQVTARSGSRDILDRENDGENDQGKDRDKSKEKDKRKDAEESKEVDREKEKAENKERDRGKDRAGSRETERSHAKDEEKDRSKMRDKERERSRDKDYDKDRSKDRDYERDRRKERESSREEEREYDVGKERGRDKNIEKDRGKERDSSRERERGRDRSRERDRIRERGRSRERSRDRDRGRERARSKEREGNGDKDRPKERGSSKEKEREKDKNRDKEKAKDEEKKSKIDSSSDKKAEKSSKKEEYEEGEEKASKSSSSQANRKPTSSSSKKK